MRFPALLVLTLAATAQTTDWVAASNKNAQVLLELGARFNPEAAAAQGMTGYDEQIIDLKPNLVERRRKAVQAAIEELRRRLAQEKDPLVRQDLEIMIAAAERQLRGVALTEKYRLPYANIGQLIFGSTQALLDEQVAGSRRPAAVVRLRRYAGLEPGYTPVAALAEQRIRERLAVAHLTGPPREQLEKDLGNTKFFLDGIAQLMQRYKLEGWQDAHARLKQQLAAYDDFIRREVTPRAAKDFRLPADLYAFSLEQYGVELAPAELAARAHSGFDEIQKQMQALAPAVAKARGWEYTDYRDVIRALKKEQLSGDGILTHYRSRIGEIEQIIRRENLVALPSRPARMRVGTPAESAAQPAPHMRPPRLIGNTGESGEFVLPLINPAAGGQRMDDFTFAAASWTLTSHEARPGHEMQFSAMVERGVSLARAIFAFNSTNVEGWGLYSEWMMFPFMPPEGQLISLQHRMMRAARAFLDPELHLGKITPAQAKNVLLNDVVLSDAMATQEVDRYTFRAPGQATSYFYGYLKLVELRQDLEKTLGAKFNARAFHDFVLGQGLLPPAMLRRAVMERFGSQ
jgi:uncharacterized protein (DUF885 family)